MKLAMKEPLLRGSDLLDMGLKPGPLYSELIDEVGEMQASGEIRTREEAINFVKNQGGPR